MVRLTRVAGLPSTPLSGIENEVCIVGNTRHIEIWSPAEWDKEMAILDVTPTASLNIDF